MIAAQSKDDDEEPKEDPIFQDGMTYEEKYEAVRAALPFNSNSMFANVLGDPDGPRCLLWALQLCLNKGVAQEGLTYDTTSTKSSLASKVVHELFSIAYVKRYKLYDPRENYVQSEGTAMSKETFYWLKSALEQIASEFFANFQMESKFVWTEFLVYLRKVWRWTRSNNSDVRKLRRARGKKKN